eukprot:scaffold443105_cov23-Prasinocladus_malaysianus.AAC.1
MGIEPTKGVIEPGSSLSLQVVCSFPDLGVAKGDVIVQTRGSSSVGNEDQAPRVSFGCTVINHSFEVCFTAQPPLSCHPSVTMKRCTKKAM